MGNISKITATTSSTVAITATQYGSVIEIQEDPDSGAAWPTSDFFIFHVQASGGSSALSRRIPAGSAYRFQKTLSVAQPYAPAEIAGYVKAVTSTMTVVVDEMGS